MKVRYVGVFDAVVIRLPDGTPVEVARNHQTDVPDDLGQSLLDQPDNWRPVAPRKATPADGNTDGEEE